MYICICIYMYIIIPGKALLSRMIPLGLINYLKHAPINEEHRCALDEIEEEFYTATLGLNADQVHTRLHLYVCL
jgi:hypothetical protein